VRDDIEGIGGIDADGEAFVLGERAIDFGEVFEQRRDRGRSRPRRG